MMHSIRWPVVFATVCVALTLSPDSAAQTWFGGEGNWDVKENWIPQEVPTGSGGVEINGTARILGVDAGSNEARLGYVPDQSGAVEVRLEGGRWANVGVIYAGYAEGASGRILVDQGGAVFTEGAVLGFGFNGSGELHIRGTGSIFSTGGITVGDRAEGTLLIEDGGKLESSGGVFVGFQRETSGMATITGAGSFMQVAGRVVIGYNGGGVLTVQSGAAATSDEVIVGGGYVTSQDLGGAGRLTITGKNSSWVSSGRLVVGSTFSLPDRPSDGVMSVQDGAKFSAAGAAAIGLLGTGSVVVEGAGSEWSVAGTQDTFIGQDWKGSLFVFNGGKATVTSPRTIIGNTATGAGELKVAGAGASFTSTGPLIVGINGTATLTVENGGKVSAAQVTVGGQNISTGVFVPDIVNLNGGDTPQSRGVLETALFSNTFGDIKFDGGVLRATTSQFSFIQPVTGRPLQIGTHGAFIDSNGFDIGLERPFSGVGGLTKQGAGTLTLMQFVSTYLGATVVEQGTLQAATPFPTVVQNFLPTTTALVIGNANDVGSAAFNLNGVNQRVGSLRSVGTNMSRTVTNSSATAATFTVEQSVDTTFAGQITGNLGLTKLGAGTLLLTGTNTYTGPTSVNQGTLRVEGSIASNVTVAAGAVLSGRGSIGRLTVASGGVFSPGASPGSMTVAGDLVLSEGSTYLVDLAGTAAGTQYDQTSVMGAVSLANAILNVNLTFLPAGGELFAILLNDGVDPVVGSFIGLAEGATFSAGNTLFTISYVGGSGNDVVLSAAAPVPEPSTLLLSAMGLLLLGFAHRARGHRPEGNHRSR